eukprot:127757-Amphidinium_carterae.1
MDHRSVDDCIYRPFVRPGRVCVQDKLPSCQEAIRYWDPVCQQQIVNGPAPGAGFTVTRSGSFNNTKVSGAPLLTSPIYCIQLTPPSTALLAK